MLPKSEQIMLILMMVVDQYRRCKVNDLMPQWKSLIHICWVLKYQIHMTSPWSQLLYPFFQPSNPSSSNNGIYLNLTTPKTASSFGPFISPLSNCNMFLKNGTFPLTSAPLTTVFQLHIHSFGEGKRFLTCKKFCQQYFFFLKYTALLALWKKMFLISWKI